MRKMLHLCIWLHAVRCHQAKITLSAQEGGLVDITCRYDPGYERYPKYFLKGVYGKRSTLIDTTVKWLRVPTQKGKYYIFDDTKQRILRVTIYNLSLNDAGTYWCEIDAYLFDPKTEIELTVCKAPGKPPLVTSNRPMSTTPQAMTRNQSAATTDYLKLTKSASSASLVSTPLITAPLPPALSPLVVFVVVSAFLLLSLLAVMYFRLRKDTPIISRTTSGCERDPQINTGSMDGASAQIITEQEETTCHFSSPSTDTGDQHLLYATVCFNAEAAAQPRERTRSAAGPSEVYAAIRHTET